ncbi:Amino Acid/Auxin Permease (AAAP) Family [Phytophthora infestans T30-4]|uniref:Amino Acid/Auxin Permease (AAAP) Family n=1 Tax=Phytophthora infestans (strain T30-4) TaxID=403677 RepID=D0MW87_PHYIT|nr:Amino Acid/Auxin Permease (AAAP) Family [Phytophthora infestans T30-4]EEY63900.1 Amino Acid/Auxin Permease (AAAP) Family [Phytophthora infestans T30-4]|eukprot:XP_002907336.1 Amino Acid/Auxin Permease (AAAP) Family [Phytophthora infestans T30-4]
MVVSSDETSPLIPLSPQPLSSIQRHRHRRESFETGFPLVVATEIDVQSTVQESEADSPRASVSVSPCQWLGHNCAVPFTLLMSAIGAGTLAVPYTFVLLSPVQAVLLLCCVGLAMAFTADTLVGVHVAVVTQSVDELQESRETYQHLAWRAGGKPLARLTGALTALAVFGACVGCVRVVKDMAPVMLSTVINGFEQWSQTEQQHAVATTVWVIVLVVVLPLGCLTKISALRFSSYFGVAFSVYLVGAYEASLFWRVSEAVGIYNFTFMLHLNVIPLLAQLNVGGTEAPVAVDLLQTAARTMRRHLALAVGVCILLYATFGICAAHIYGSKTQGNILLNLSNDRIMAVPRVAILLTILLSFPLLFHPLRSLVLEMYMACTSRNTPEEENGSAPSQFVQAVGTVSLLVAQIICALRVPGLQVVFSFVGASILLMLCYLFPLIFYVRLTSWRSSRKEIARLAILSSVGLVATVFCVAATLQLVFPA